MATSFDRNQSLWRLSGEGHARIFLWSFVKIERVVSEMFKKKLRHAQTYSYMNACMTDPRPCQLTLYLLCQFWGLPVQQKIKTWRQKNGHMGIELYDWVENIVGKGEIASYKQFILFPQCFQKLSSVDASKWVSMEKRVKPAYHKLAHEILCITCKDTAWLRLSCYSRNNRIIFYAFCKCCVWHIICNAIMNYDTTSYTGPARVAQWWACQTHDLVVVSSIPRWGDFSFQRIFAFHLCRSMWEK